MNIYEFEKRLEKYKEGNKYNFNGNKYNFNDKKYIFNGIKYNKYIDEEENTDIEFSDNSTDNSTLWSETIKENLEREKARIALAEAAAKKAEELAKKKAEEEARRKAEEERLRKEEEERQRKEQEVFEAEKKLMPEGIRLIRKQD